MLRNVFVTLCASLCVLNQTVITNVTQLFVSLWEKI